MSNEKESHMLREDALARVQNLLLALCDTQDSALGAFQNAFEGLEKSPNAEEAYPDGLSSALSYAISLATADKTEDVQMTSPSDGFLHRVKLAAQDISSGAALVFINEAVESGVSEDDDAGLMKLLRQGLLNYVRVIQTNAKVSRELGGY